jgi:hypothetical protein
MELSETMRVFPIRGNCDLWCDFLFKAGSDGDARLSTICFFKKTVWCRRCAGKSDSPPA